MNRDDVLEFLHHPFDYVWQVQGFGMLRTYIEEDKVRLQIWDQRLAVWGNNAIHDHPWDFHSTIIAGQIVNQRYARSTKTVGERSFSERIGTEYLQAQIQPGPEGGQLSDPVTVKLLKYPVEIYAVGESYEQRADELHITRYLNGTVTLLERERVRTQDVAHSLWRPELPWTFYKPRPATPVEIARTISECRTRWFGDESHPH